MASSAHSHSLRLGRVSEPGRIYLITFATHQRRTLFSSLDLGRLVVKELRQAHSQGIVASMAWVVMPDHVHWLLALKTGSLEMLVKQVKARSARSINRTMGRQGRVWQQGFHDRAMRYDEDLATAARYIVMNPVRAGCVKRVGEYPLWDAVWV